MDQTLFTKLTGKSLAASQASRFEDMAALAAEQLGEILGWPLDPSDYGDQYIETGKLRTEDWFCSNVEIDEADLADPDEVVGATRLFRYRKSDRFLAIDPAIEIHAVKIVRNGITYRTLDSDDYSVNWTNGKHRFTRYLEIRQCRYCSSYCWLNRCDDFQLAIDATWAFGMSDDEPPVTLLPKELQKVWADLIWDEANPKKDVKSESITSHSYTRYDRQEASTVHAKTLAKYVGPNGTAKRPRIA